MTTTHHNHVSEARSSAISDEQAYVDALFKRLDDEVARANLSLSSVMKDVDPANPDPEALVRRETEYHGLNQKIDRLNLAQLGLIFGRIDVEMPASKVENPAPHNANLDRRYIGRMGLDDRNDNYRTLLLDWRTPAARPFYLATTLHPEGVHVRRHIRTQGRIVTGVTEEQLSGDHAHYAPSSDVGSETALLYAINAARTGHMRNIVETIQREQDEIIRDSYRGVIVVQGGPGTGKTAVALHRVAYLLYTWREYLAKTGVLIIGPNSTFLNYISRVLPELGETGVVLATIADLYPGISTPGIESLLTQEIKGSGEMSTILANAVHAYQIIPEQPIMVSIDGVTISITSDNVRKSRTRARRSRRPHNSARAIFQEHLIEQLAFQLAQTIGADPLGGKNLLSAADIDQLHDDLLDDETLLATIDRFWPELAPELVLRELLSSTVRIEQAAADYDEETKNALKRDSDAPWAPSDAALLDELAFLIGILDPEESRKKADQEFREQVEDAQEVLDVLSSSQSSDIDDVSDAEVLSAFDVIDAETLAQRQSVRDSLSTAQRAQLDHKWAYGHVIVDEAQELSPMEWRMVFRRCPSHWMTLIGDIAQTSSPAGVDDWAQALHPFIGKRFHQHELSVNYRTPAEIMSVADRILSRINPDIMPAQTIRDSGIPVEFLGSDTDAVAVQHAYLSTHPDRSVAIITSRNSLAENPTGTTVADVKGLEYDHVIVVDPQGIFQESPQGLQDLYVACTRATQQLTVVGNMDFI